MPDTQQQATIRFAATLVLDLNGENAEAMAERIERTVYEATFGAGAVTGGTEAEVDEHYFDVVLLKPEAASLDEESLADWLSRQIEDGHMALEDLPKLMARYALADPADLRNELAERMRQQAGDAGAESPAAMPPAPCIRVQMVSGGIPAYQNDFASEDEAKSAGESLALGAKAAKVAPQSGELFRFQSERTTIRAFAVLQRA